VVATSWRWCARTSPRAPQPAIVGGTVTEAATGEVVPGVPVAVGATWWPYTDEHWPLRARVAPAGRVTVTIAADYLQPVSRAVTAPATIDLAVTFDLDGGEQVIVEDSAPITAGLHTIDAATAARQAGTGGDALKAAGQRARRGPRQRRHPRAGGLGRVGPRHRASWFDDVPSARRCITSAAGGRSCRPSWSRAMAIDRAGFATPWSGATGGLIRVASRELPSTAGASAAVDPIDVGAVAWRRLGPLRVAVGGRVSYLDRTIGALLDGPTRERIPIPRWADGQALAQWSEGADRVDGLLLVGGDRLARTLPALDPAAAKRDRRAEDFARLAVGWRRALARGETRARLWLGLDRVTREQRFGAVPAEAATTTRSLGARVERQATRGGVVAVAGVDASLALSQHTRSGSLSIPTREGDVAIFGQPPGDDVAADAWSALTGDVAGYVQLDIVRGAVTVSPGVRVDAWLLGASRVTPVVGATPAVGWQDALVTVEPRLAAQVRRGPAALSVAAGRYHQPRRADDASAVFGTPVLGVEAAWHAAVTVAYALPTVDLELTGWGRRSGGLVARDPSPTPMRAAVLTQAGQGRAAGLELVARLRRWRGLSGWLAYGFTASVRQDAAGAAWRRFEHEQPHQLTIAAVIERGPWAASLRARYATGEPRTDVRGAFWDARGGRYQPIVGPIYGMRLPAFAQLDLRGERTLTVGGAAATLFVEIENLTARANAEEVVWSGDYAVRGYLEGLPFLALAGGRVSW
jgi:hypothetical protein